MNASSIILISSAALLSSCWQSNSDPVETVMCPGDVLEYQASTGRRLVIRATDTVQRLYFFDQILKFQVRLTPRPSRWYGSRGLYRPVGVGGTHMVLEEAVQHFSSIDEANEWVRLRVHADPADSMAAIDEDGLFVLWNYRARPAGFKGGPNAILNVDIYQILVDLKEPQGLLKISDDTIAKNLSSACDAKSLEPGFMPSKPSEINGRTYSGRALDFMREQGISTADVETAIATGKRIQHGSETGYYPRKRPSELPGVWLDASGKVIKVAF